MKKIISLALFLVLCATDLESREEVTRFSFNCPDTVCCKRGRRGRRGRRGPTGRAGTAVDPGANELFVNAEIMEGGVFDNVTVPMVILEPYGLGDFSTIPTWALTPPGGLPAVTTTFDLPIDMDVTQPVIIVAHMFVDSSTLISGNTARLGVALDIEGNNDLIGIIPPATGPQFSAQSADFTVIPATPPATGNLRQISVAIPINLAAATVGEWVYFEIIRIPATAGEFSGNLYLSTVSVQYQRLAS